MENAYQKNISYLFVPLTTEDLEQFSVFRKGITKAHGWLPAGIENRYLHRYVLEQLSKDGEDSCSCFRLQEDYAREHGLQLGAKWYSTGEKKFKGTKIPGFHFTISDVFLFTFDTPLCILAFELGFREDDPLYVASAQYYLRKINAEKIYFCQGAEQGLGENFAEISSRLLQNCAPEIKLDLFFYATRDNEKANFLTYVDVPAQDDYKKELFYLKWCYSDRFDYCADLDDAGENYRASMNTQWGITVSSAVCLVNRSEEQSAFIQEKFQKNFKTQYLLLYVLLLHQKYMMYLFLTKMAAGLSGNVAQLEKYKTMLYDFETHYMISYVSEVPQYQKLYAKVRKAFALEEMFRGVQEPLLQLADIKKQKTEREERESDNRVNTSLTILSFLTIISALTDASGITANLEWLIPARIAQYIQLGALAVVVGVSILMFVRLIRSKKR